MRRAPLLGCLLLLPGFLAAAAGRAQASDEEIVQKAGLRLDPAALEAWFVQRTSSATQDHIDSLIRQLGSRRFSQREKATTQLVNLGAQAVPGLERALNDLDAEIRRRAQLCLDRIQADARPDLVAAAARLLAARKREGTAQVLLDFLPAVGDPLAEEAIHEVLASLALVKDRAEPALLKALKDSVPCRRAAAAVALCRGKVKDVQSVLPLLADADPGVRLHAGLALAARGEKKAIPVLIELFTVLPRSRLWKVEDVLYQLAEERAPSVAPGDDEANRKFRDAWLGWWKAENERIDLNSLHAKKFLGRTLIVLLDEGQVLELDPRDKVRFTIKDLSFPLDIEYLTGDRVLIAEHGASRVCERFRDGTILWQAKAVEPIAAQRLPGGRTFVCTKDALLILDRAGKEIWRQGLPNADQFMRARALPSGDMIFVTQSGWCIRLDAAGKEQGRFRARVDTFGGRLDVLPNGNVLIPHMFNDQVVEYDRDGKRVREFNVAQPIMAARLPGGTTLFTSMTQKRAIELDLAGKQVWEYKRDTRVTRAYRR